MNQSLEKHAASISRTGRDRFNITVCSADPTDARVLKNDSRAKGNGLGIGGNPGRRGVPTFTEPTPAGAALPRRDGIRMLSRSVLCVLAMCTILGPPCSFAQPAPATRPAETDRSLLTELNRETQSLYRDLQGGILRVELPDATLAKNGNAQDNWIVKQYPYLNNDMRQRLIDQANPPARNNYPNAPPSPAGNNTAVPSARQAIGNSGSNDGTNSSNSTAPSNQSQNSANLTIIIPPLPQEQQAAQINNGLVAQQAGNGLATNNIGLLLDKEGHVLVPQYVDRDAVGDQPIHLIGAVGDPVDAKLVGSDQQTGLTVLQLNRPAAAADGKQSQTASNSKVAKDGDSDVGRARAATQPAVQPKPVTLSRTKPAEGTLVLLLSPADGTGRLDVWNGGGRDYAVVVNMDGQVAGVARYGQFLSGAACQLIADQIIRNGAVRRATLGVIITQIEQDAPQRRGQPLLGDKPAVRVDEIIAGSVAERGGLRQGDILLTLDGEPANDIPTVAAAIAAKSGRTRLQVIRGDRVIELTVDLQRK